MVGAATDGYCDTGRLRMPKMPARMIKMEITQAKIGRSIKNLAMFHSVYWADDAAGADAAAEAAGADAAAAGAEAA